MTLNLKAEVKNNTCVIFEQVYHSPWKLGYPTHVVAPEFDSATPLVMNHAIRHNPKSVHSSLILKEVVPKIHLNGILLIAVIFKHLFCTNY